MTKANLRTHSVTLSDGARRYGITLADGPRSIQETPVTPSTLLINQQGSKFGDYDPSMSHLEQRTWVGGRGNEEFATDASRFFDAQNLNTMIDQFCLPSYQWAIATGYKSADQYLPGNMEWKSLVGTTRYLAQSFVASSSYTDHWVYVWLRRRGNPADLTYELCSDTAGAPGTVLDSCTITANDLNDVSVFQRGFAGAALTNGTTYWIKVYGAASSISAAHWEIGVDTGTASAKSSSNGSAWSATTFKLYYRVAPLDVALRYQFFMLLGVMRAVSIYDDGSTPSKVFTVSGSVWTEVTSTGLGVVTDVCVCNNIAYFAQGENTNIRRWDGTNWAADGNNRATFLWTFYSKADNEAVVWRGNNGTTKISVSKAISRTWGNNLTFKAQIVVGDASFPITSLVDYNDLLWVLKQDSIWYVDDKGITSKLGTGTDQSPSSANGVASVRHGLFLFYSFLHSVSRLYGGTVDDVGPQKDGGLPSGRQGFIVDLQSVHPYLFAAEDAGDGWSCVMVYDGTGYHEVFRPPSASQRVRGIKWQPGSATVRPRLWISVGDDIYYLDFPLATFNPMRDTGVKYMHEAVLVTSSFDMGAARLPKFYKELHAITQNLGGGIRIGMDYQYDNAINSDKWITVGEFSVSPDDTMEINEGDRNSLRVRLRLMTNNATKPPIIKATVLEGVARTPVKYHYTFRGKLATNQTTLTGTPDANPDAFLRWLKNAAKSASLIYMRSTLEDLDYKVVLIEPPTPFRDFLNSILKLWGGTVLITVREA